MNSQVKNGILEPMVELLELPDSAYEKAKSRYEDLGQWLCREDSTCATYEPHVFPQGSFRTGTAIRPLDETEEYDLDLACELSEGITKATRSQQELKLLVGREIESYRVAKAIKAATEEKHRCWRLNYADTISFHMDIVPCIPEMQSRRLLIKEAMRRAGTADDLAGLVSELTVAITDDRHVGYSRIYDDWYISNPEGYAKWFETRMKLAQRLLAERVVMFKAAQVDDLPVYRWKTPLQGVIQLLKRHRDQMFKDDPDVKPVSPIITTLAARAYQGEGDLESALARVLSQMEGLVNSKSPRIPNPVNPNEDFADRWSRLECRHLKLEENFWNWLTQAKTDFALLGSSKDAGFITAQAKQKFSVSMNSDTLAKRLGLTQAVILAPKVHTINEPAKPWRAED